MNKSPDGRFELILDTSSDHFMAKSKDWYVVDTKGERRTIATFSSSNGIYKVKFSPDGWSIIASNALGKVVEEIDLKKIAEDEGFSRTRRGVRGALGSEEAPRGLPLNPYYDWTPEAARRFTFAWKPENVRTQFDRARTGMIARLEERIAEAPPLRLLRG